MSEQQSSELREMSPSRPPAAQMPSLSMRAKSSMIMGLTGLISRCFLHGFNTVEVHGLAQFRELLDSRADPKKRERGLLTVSNHVSVLDDPMVWGLLPLSYAFNPNNLRWTLGAHDICFKNKLFASFFTHGQVLPCHRSKHSTHGGLFQPCMTQAIRLLSNPSPAAPSETHYSTTGTDSILSPLTHPYYRRYSWVHVFPEGLVHQHPDVDLRYFKWGVARLILESEPRPDIVPMFIDGTQKCMAEDRGFPKFLPRVGKTVRVTFGGVLDYDEVFGDLKSRWDELVRRERGKGQNKTRTVGWLWKTPVVGQVEGGVVQTEEQQQVGELHSEQLRHGKEATEIRIEVARRMREEILKLRRERGVYKESDESFGRAETWRVDKGEEGKKYRSRVDGSQINQD
ncbi:putative lysophosphatidylcholine acyltransferase [Triangularia setosa]|uniref:Tafazzin family protein n=1 Tax=Triangularia setosa TaxID=2587417 RepID=A0AAN7A8T8_9PEZI|nr:putative lysophosphatidylcholine acyltransferase [Podospora setosa]